VPSKRGTWFEVGGVLGRIAGRRRRKQVRTVDLAGGEVNELAPPPQRRDDKREENKRDEKGMAVHGGNSVRLEFRRHREEAAARRERVVGAGERIERTRRRLRRLEEDDVPVKQVVDL